VALINRRFSFACRRKPRRLGGGGSLFAFPVRQRIGGEGTLVQPEKFPRPTDGFLRSFQGSKHRETRFPDPHHSIQAVGHDPLQEFNLALPFFHSDRNLTSWRSAFHQGPIWSSARGCRRAGALEVSTTKEISGFRRKAKYANFEAHYT
jgi:hypothetical protein